MPKIICMAGTAWLVTLLALIGLPAFSAQSGDTDNPEFSVTGKGNFSGMSVDFRQGAAVRAEDGLIITIKEPTNLAMEFMLPVGDGERLLQLGPDKPGTVKVNGQEGTGTLYITRDDGALGGQFEVDVSVDGKAGTLSGSFDHLPVESMASE